MKQTLPIVPAQALDAPTAPFVGLDTLWIQLTGTWCNLECAHCLNASGPRDPWLKPLAPAVVRAAIADASVSACGRSTSPAASRSCTPKRLR